MLLGFGEIEELVGPLPRGARQLHQWWTNETTAQAQAWLLAGWRVLLADTGSERVLFQRLLPRPPDPHPSGTPEQAESSARSYLDDVHVPLLSVLVVLSVIIGAIGFAIRPGADQPPVVPTTDFYLSLIQQSRDGTPSPRRELVEETMEQQDPSTVLVQLDIFAVFAATGPVSWTLLESDASSPGPYSCPDPATYLGTAVPDPVDFSGSRPTIGGQAVTRAELGNFTGHIARKSSSFGLYGTAPGVVRAGALVPVAELDLCWTTDRPMAFDGQFASASLPGIQYGAGLSMARNLYFDNPQENHQDITAQYSLQAGTPPTSTSPYGWHWTASKDGDPVQLTAMSIPESQNSEYLGFVSGVLFGVAGGALVLILQELLEPIRIRRRTQRENGAMTKIGGRSKVLWAGSGGIAAVAVALAVMFAITHTDRDSGPDETTPGNIQPQSHVLIIDYCGFESDEGLIEPATILLACGDGEIAAVGLTWTQWGTTTATGYGTVTEDNCVPNCADGTDVPYQATVTLSRPVKGHDGKEYFIRITLIFTGKHPGNSPTQLFKSCEDTPSSPFMPTCPLSDQGFH